MSNNYYDTNTFRSFIAVSKCNRLTVVQWHKIALTLRKILRCGCAHWKIHDFILFPNLLSVFTHFMSMFRDFIAIFLRKGFKSQIVTPQKKSLLECLFH